MSASDDTNREQDGQSQWRLADGRNPYLHNTFVLLGIDPDAGQQEFNRQVQQISARLAADQELQRFGRRVDDAELARAERLSTEREAFAAERLLAHTVHRVNVEDFAELLKAIEALTFPAPADLLPLPLVNLNVLASLLLAAESRAGLPIENLDLTALCEVARPTAQEERAAIY